MPTLPNIYLTATGDDEVIGRFADFLKSSPEGDDPLLTHVRVLGSACGFLSIYTLSIQGIGAVEILAKQFPELSMAGVAGFDGDENYDLFHAESGDVVWEPHSTPSYATAGFFPDRYFVVPHGREGHGASPERKE